MYNLSTTHCPKGKACNEETLSSNLTIYPATYQGIVYLDPTDLSKECNENNSVSRTGTKEGCMRFYIYDSDDNYYYAILDHNTTAAVDPNRNIIEDCGGDCFVKAQEVVKEDTALWTAVYYGENDARNPRNISAEEVWKVTKATNNVTEFNVSSSYSFYFGGSGSVFGQGYGWLFDRTSMCTFNRNYGCTNYGYTWGYWTSSRKSESIAWSVQGAGILSLVYNDPNNPSGYIGVRPVITIQK